MQIKYIDQTWLKREVRDILSKHLQLDKYKIFFFGSRVKGDSFERSDIDIGVLGPAPLDATTKLEIEEELDNLPTLYTFDLVDFKNTSATFRKHALGNIEYLN